VILETRTYSWPDEAACATWAQAMAAKPRVRDASIELRGPLGAGKTTFVRHLLRSLGVQGRIKSPSYAIVEPYELPALNVWHFDYYRFGDPREWEDAGFRELYAEPGLKLSEWPEQVGAAMPEPDLRLSIEPDVQDPQQRHVQADALTPTGRELLP
jgi:tRNA threonylcarbamoyladenosine biosynthesis protein TsaE